MSLTQSSVGVTSGPDWATNTEANWSLIDAHDHSSGKGVQITPAGININADLEFNANDATELRTVAFDSSADATTTADRRCIYESGGDIYWRNASGTAVQITSGTAVGSGVGSIDGMGGTEAEVQYNDTALQKSFSFIHDKSVSPKSVAKMAFSDFSVYNFTNANDLVTVKYTGSGASGVLTLPDETGTLVSSASTVSDISVTSTTTLKPILTLANNTNDSTAPTISFKNLRDSNNGVNGDDAGTINFYANDDAGNNQIFSQIIAEISDATSGGEEGKISISVAEYDGTVTPGFILTGTSTDGEVDVTIGAGTASVTSIAGTLDLGDRAILNVGDIDCDSISVADAANGLEINFNGNTGTNKITLTDHLASALDITEASNSYLKFVTTNSSEQIVFGQNSTFNGTTIADLGTVTTADINGGTIDGTDVTVGSGKTLNVSAGTLTTSTAQNEAIVSDGVPANIVAYTSAGSAPSGWSEYVAARGRMIVGLPSGGSNEGTTGTAFTDQQNKSKELAHSHTSAAHAHGIFYMDMTATTLRYDTGGRYGASGTFTADRDIGTGATGVGSLGIPTSESITPDPTGTKSGADVTTSTSDLLAYIQLMAIEKD